ncbi:MAG: hypothetical protein R2867_27370 [Caldilineaceae bacterium]
MNGSVFKLGPVTTMRWQRLLVIWALGLMVVVSGATPVVAHGSGGILRIDGASLGPYTVMIWTSPSILRPGEVHVETAVLRGRSRVLNCRIVATLTPLDGDAERLLATAGAANVANDYRHEAAFHLDKPGRYYATVAVYDELARGGDATFELEISPLSHFVRGFIYLQVVIVALATLWTLKIGIEFVGANRKK